MRDWQSVIRRKNPTFGKEFSLVFGNAALREMKRTKATSCERSTGSQPSVHVNPSELTQLKGRLLPAWHLTPSWEAYSRANKGEILTRKS